MRTLLFALLVSAVFAGEPPDLLAPQAKVTEAGRGFSMTAGPAVAKDGSVFFTDVPNDRIMLWMPDGTISTWKEECGGATGLLVHTDLLYACLGERRQMVTFAMDGTLKPLSYKGGGKRFNSPNDLWVDSQDGVYFTDARYGSRDNMEQNGEFVWYISPGVSEAILAAKDFTRPSGIVGTPDGRYLYVADHEDKVVWKYNITGPGQLADRMKFCSEGSDGMCLDAHGNLYLTWRKGIQVYDHEGTKLGTIPMPVEPTNLCFGGPQRSTLFITGGGSVHTLEMKVRGVE